jgi:hypothetical protein
MYGLQSYKGETEVFKKKKQSLPAYTKLIRLHYFFSSQRGSGSLYALYYIYLFLLTRTGISTYVFKFVVDVGCEFLTKVFNRSTLGRRMFVFNEVRATCDCV